MILIPSSSELTEFWVAIEDKLEVSTIKDAISSTQLLDSLPAKHIIGLSAVDMLNGKPVVFATSLDARGPAVYRIGKLGHTLIATGEHLPTQLCL